MERMTDQDKQQFTNGLTHQFRRLSWVIRFGKRIIRLLLSIGFGNIF